jgi:hypothetical protein
MFGEILGALGNTALAVVTTAAPTLLTGLVIKHGGKLTRKIPNAAIPAAGFIVGTAVGAITTGDAQAAVDLGMKSMLGGVGIHQVVKIGFQSTVGKLTGSAATWLNQKHKLDIRIPLIMIHQFIDTDKAVREAHWDNWGELMHARSEIAPPAESYVDFVQSAYIDRYGELKLVKVEPKETNC